MDVAPFWRYDDITNILDSWFDFVSFNHPLTFHCRRSLIMIFPLHVVPLHVCLTLMYDRPLVFALLDWIVYII